jgi:hypothetical protein
VGSRGGGRRTRGEHCPGPRALGWRHGGAPGRCDGGVKRPGRHPPTEAARPIVPAPALAGVDGAAAARAWRAPRPPPATPPAAPHAWPQRGALPRPPGPPRQRGALAGPRGALGHGWLPTARGRRGLRHDDRPRVRRRVARPSPGARPRCHHGRAPAASRDRGAGSERLGPEGADPAPAPAAPGAGAPRAWQPRPPGPGPARGGPRPPHPHGPAAPRALVPHPGHRRAPARIGSPAHRPGGLRESARRWMAPPRPGPGLVPWRLWATPPEGLALRVPPAPLPSSHHALVQGLRILAPLLRHAPWSGPGPQSHALRPSGWGTGDA